MHRKIQALKNTIVKIVGVTTSDHHRRIVVHTNKGPYWYIIEWTQKIRSSGATDGGSGWAAGQGDSERVHYHNY